MQLLLLLVVCCLCILYKMDASKFVALGESMQLTGSELKVFVTEQMREWRENEKAEREDRQREREEKKRDRDREIEEKEIVRVRDEREKEKDRERDERERERVREERERDRERAEKEKEIALAREKERLDDERYEKAKERDFELRKLEMAREEKLKMAELGLSGSDTSFGSNVSGTPTAHRVKIKMPFYDEGKDDMDAYLQRFERVMSAQGLEERDWATQLAVLLKGKALDTYIRLPIEQAGEYHEIKAALLKRYDLTEDGFRRKFRSAKIDPGESHTQFTQRLRNYLKRWVELSKTEETYDGLTELLLKEQLLNSSERDLALFLRERTPKTSHDMAVLAEQYREARHGYSVPSQPTRRRDSQTDTQGNQGNPSQQDRGKSDASDKTPPTSTFSGTRSVGPQIQCFSCGKMGHRARECSRRTGVKEAGVCEMIGTFITTDGGTSPSVLYHCNGKYIKILRDTGCTTVVLKRSLLPDNMEVYKRPYKRINGVEADAPCRSVHISAPYFTGRTEALLFDTPLYDVVIGNIPGARERTDPDKEWTDFEVHPIADEAGSNIPYICSDDIDATTVQQLQVEDDSLDKLHELAKQYQPTD